MNPSSALPPDPSYSDIRPGDPPPNALVPRPKAPTTTLEPLPAQPPDRAPADSETPKNPLDKITEQLENLPEGKNLLALAPPQPITLPDGRICTIGGNSIIIGTQKIQVSAVIYDIPLVSLVRIGKSFQLVLNVPEKFNIFGYPTEYKPSAPETIASSDLASLLQKLCAGEKPSKVVEKNGKKQTITLSLA